MKVAHYLPMISLVFIWRQALGHFTPGNARKAPVLGLGPELAFYLLHDLGQVV